MGRWRVSWGARNLSVLLAWLTARTRLPLWFRATVSSVRMEVSPDMAAGSAGSAGCLFMRVSLWRSLRQDKSQKRRESPQNCRHPRSVGWPMGAASGPRQSISAPPGTLIRDLLDLPRAINIRASVQDFGNLTEGRCMYLGGRKPVEALEAHDQWAPLVRVDAIGVAFHQHLLSDMHTLDPHLEQFNPASDFFVVLSKVFDVLDDRFELYRTLLYTGRGHCL